jgi:hypothetical protein
MVRAGFGETYRKILQKHSALPLCVGLRGLACWKCRKTGAGSVVFGDVLLRQARAGGYLGVEAGGAAA